MSQVKANANIHRRLASLLGQSIPKLRTSTIKRKFMIIRRDECRPERKNMAGILMYVHMIKLHNNADNNLNNKII
jgi:hypothetical protein